MGRGPRCEGGGRLTSKHLIAALAGVFLTTLFASTSQAEGPTPGGSYGPRPDRPTLVETNVVATDAGVTIFVSIESNTPGLPGTPGSTDLISNPAAPVCSATATHVGAISDWAHQGLQAHPDAIPFAVNCDDGYFGIAWVPVGAPGDPDVVVEVLPGDAIDPEAVAQSLLGLVPLPPITVGANPGTGLVALPSWFWVEGYGGEPLTGAETLGGTTVEVEVTPARYDWDFGDGGQVSATSLGQPYPAESEIQHRYEQSSLVAGGAFAVRLEITFSARYRVITEEDDGAGGSVTAVGDWQATEPIVRTFERAYPVQQLQSVLAADQH